MPVIRHSRLTSTAAIQILYRYGFMFSSITGRTQAFHLKLLTLESKTLGQYNRGRNNLRQTDGFMAGRTDKMRMTQMLRAMVRRLVKLNPISNQRRMNKACFHQRMQGAIQGYFVGGLSHPPGNLLPAERLICGQHRRQHRHAHTCRTQSAPFQHFYSFFICRLHTLLKLKNLAKYRQIKT